MRGSGLGTVWDRLGGQRAGVAGHPLPGSALTRPVFGALPTRSGGKASAKVMVQHEHGASRFSVPADDVF